MRIYECAICTGRFNVTKEAITIRHKSVVDSVFRVTLQLDLCTDCISRITKSVSDLVFDKTKEGAYVSDSIPATEV